jgi:hypothetical protein
VIRNKAAIYFDFNEPIVTNEVFNTIDADAPASHLDPLPPVAADPHLLLSWSGDDIVPGSDPPFEGSGVRSFTILSRLDGGTYTPIITDIFELTGEFQARGGGTYEFYSVATDNVGNVESAPPVADATTTVALQRPFMPEVGSLTATTAQLVSLGTANLDRIEHAVMDQLSELYVQPDGTLGIESFWQPLDQWSNLVVRDLEPCAIYELVARARSDEGTETLPSDPTVVFTTVQGDVDGDGLVTGADLDLVQGSLGICIESESFDARADLNGDGCVTFADRGLVLAHLDRGDFNRDGYGWYDDVASFADPTCLLGPGVSVPATCRQGDFDLDGDMDLGDSAELQQAFLSDADPCEE